jgi:hypothetical protein
VNSARDTDTVKEIIHNTQKTHVDISWKEISGKKRIWNSSKMSTSRKQPKVNRYQPSKPVPTTNFFEEFEEKLDDEHQS